MSSISDYLEAAWLNHTFRATAHTPPSTLYLALYSVAPTDAGGGTEMTGGGYGRETIAFAAYSGRKVENSADVDFTASGSDYAADIVAVGLRDASSGGNLLAWDTVTAKTITDGDTYTIAAGDFDISVDASGATGGMTDFTAQKLLELTFRNVAWTSPTTVYTGVFTVAPTDSTSGTEATGAGYARQGTAFDAPSGGAVDNTAAEAFVASGGSWTGLEAEGTFDASTGGNLLWFGADFTATTVADGDTINFAAGAIVRSLT